MADDPHIGLDNPAFQGRFKSDGFGAAPEPVQKPMPKEYSQAIGGDPLPRPAAIAPEPQPTVHVEPYVAPIVPVAPVPSEPNKQIELVKPEPFVQPSRSKLSKSKVLARQTVGRPLINTAKRAHKTWNPIQMIVIGFACAVFIVGLGISLNTMRSNNQAQAQLDKITKTAFDQQKVKMGQVLGSTTTSKTPSSAVPPTDPSSIKISSLNLNTNIEPVTSSANNVLSGPSNRLNVGWNAASSRPADPNGLMILDGFHGTKNLPGAFANLNKIKVNDSITIVRGDNQYYTYTVVRVTDFDPLHSDTTTLLVPAKAGVPALDLITLSSGGDDTNNSVGTIVYAVQQS